MADIEMPTPAASKVVARMLSEALAEHPDVQWLGLVSEDGFAIASEGQKRADDDAVAARATKVFRQVRGLSDALGQARTNQVFLEGADGGICVIDRDPWVLVIVGAPGVPLGLLRYEAREIAEMFPITGRRALDSHPQYHPPVDEGPIGPATVDYTEEAASDDVDPLTEFADPLAMPVAGLDDETAAPKAADDPFADAIGAFHAPSTAPFDMPAPAGEPDLSAMPAPTGAAFNDIPPPTEPPIGPAFHLPPPV